MISQADFPLLAARPDLTYLDNVATMQKSRAVLDAVRTYYETSNANMHRAAHGLSDAATAAFEAARERVAQYLNAASAKEIVWTRGTTEGINLVAQSHADAVLREGDVVLITEMEHHSNIVPWQIVCERRGTKLLAAGVTPEGCIDLDDFAAKLDGACIAAFSHVSNAWGTVNPVHELIYMAQRAGATTVVDGAQAMPHCPVDVQALGCDFYAFSSHKTYAPLLLSSKLLTGRDAAHKRLVDMLEWGEELPVDFRDRFIYYVGPVDPVREEVVGPADPTTATRMDKFTRTMLERTGLLGMIGKAAGGAAAHRGSHRSGERVTAAD